MQESTRAVRPDALETRGEPARVISIAKGKRYVGRIVDGRPIVEIMQGENRRPLPLRLDLARHSPSGFNWGYLGSGPAQLALAILADALADSATAIVKHQLFKRDVISKLARDGWELTREAVLDWNGQ